jgi:signal transduction histidine kinase
LDNRSTFNKLSKNYFIKYLKGDGKIFSVVFFVLFLLILSGILTDIYLNYVEKNWNSISLNELSEIESITISYYKSQENFLIQTLQTLKKNLKSELNKSEEVYKFFIKELNQDHYNDFSVEIFAPNGKLIGWNKSSKISESELFPLPSIIGETFFLEDELTYHLSIIDTFHIQADEFFIFISLPIEKKYKLLNKHYKEISITNAIEEEIQAELEIDFIPYTSTASDGKKYSFEILNNKNKKIGLVTVNLPSIKAKITQIKNFTSYIQYIIVMFGVVVIGVGLRRDYKSLKSLSAKFLFLLFYLILFRVLLFLFSIPSKFLNGDITDPANYSSTFGFGVVKSPSELLVTAIFLLFISLQLFRYTLVYLKNEKKSKNKFLALLIAIIILIAFPFLLRAFAAAMQSVVFDTKLRYFKDFELLPKFVIIVMHLNVLLIGISFTFVFIVLLLHLKKLLFPSSRLSSQRDFVLTVSLVGISTFIFYFISKNPLYNIYILLVVLISLFMIYYSILGSAEKETRHYLLILFVASINTVILMNYFDMLRERNSVKNIALELNRLNEQLLKFYLNDNINKIYNSQAEKNVLLRRDVNFNSIAFINWTRSSLHQEELNSFISFYDRYGKQLGGFHVGFEPKVNINSLLGNFQDRFFVNQSKQDSLIKKIIVYSKYVEQGVPQLVVSSGIDFEVNKLGGVNFPEFLKSDLNIVNQYVNIEKVKIFQFNNDDLVQIYGDVYPNREQIKSFLQLELDSLFNDGWTEVKFGDEYYEAYVINNIDNNNQVRTVVAVAKNKFTWNLFNFFKVFIIHSTFILTLVITVTLIRLRKIIISFKSKLLLLFLFISIVPISILGFYNRSILQERSIINIQNDLKEKLALVENNIVPLINQNVKLEQAADRVNKSLKISFNIFSNTNLIYSSNKQFYDIGLIDKKLNSLVFYKLSYDKFKELYLTEQIENYEFQSYYKVVNFNGKQYVLNVNEAFNKSKVVTSTSDFDIVLFGVYSLMLVIIIFSSTIITNQISSPIQRLIKAAKALGRGDLNVKIYHREKGELRDLLDGFNKMTEELRRNQLELAQYERESAWKDMAKQVAHEIKNPLTPMKLTLQQLIVTFNEKREEFDKLFERVSATILNQIENLSQIASEFSRVAKMPNLKIEKFDLISLLNELSAIYLNEKIIISITSDREKYLIENDKSQLERVFINLIRNSIQANSNTVNIKITRSTHFIEIYFEDNGKGIPEEIQDKIFIENFSTKEQGMGLGLKISKKFLNSINGDIVLVSSSSNGTKFKIILPYDKV